ncbi:hypothetical protein KIW84_020235 [Lathyrus oleraceus]|uniref:Cytochrome P450 n=1 Tax=Pisum sativum TaxID=3888 RepID=A0A9D4Y8H5_PEA|nr:hypothetical protein KIW84_020235 [Pisum sativum]
MLMQDIVNDHRSIHMEVSKDEDIVDVLLKIQHENEHTQNHVTDINMKSIILDMFAAGTETSTGVMLWCMSEVVENTKCVIKETLRLHLTAPLLVPREFRERCQINRYEIPTKSRVIVNVWAIGRDPRYWVEDESFKPKIFLNNPIDFKRIDYEFIPFGAGRRMCPGIAFSLPSIELYLAQLLYHFNWMLPNDMKNEKLDMTESFGITSRRKHDVFVIFEIHCLSK